MPTNQQQIAMGLIAVQPYLDFETVEGSFTQDEFGTSRALQDNGFQNPPSVFIDGILLTYVVATDRRYAEFNPETKTLFVKGGRVQLGEYVQIFL